MKKLLTVLGTISTIGPSGLTMMAMTSDTNISPQKDNYVLDSFKNIVKVYNWKEKHNENIDTVIGDKIISSVPWNFYTIAVNKEEWDRGKLLTWESTPRNDTKIIKSYENTYTNDTDLMQISKTQSRKETVTETHEFSMNLTERVISTVQNTVSGKISIPLSGSSVEDSISFSFGSESSNEKSWSDSKTFSVEETFPSQEIKQNPHTILHVKYLVTQGTMDYTGIAQFKITDFISKNIKLPIFYWTPSGYFEDSIDHNLSINDIVKMLKSEGYTDQLSNPHSILSLDNVENPTAAYLNLPITWSSQNSGIDLSYYEEQI